MSERICSKCGEPSLPYSTYCRSCKNAYQREWNKNNPDKVARKTKKSYERRKANGKLPAWKQEYYARPEMQAHTKELSYQSNQRQAERRQNDPEYRARYNAYMRDLHKRKKQQQDTQPRKAAERKE